MPMPAKAKHSHCSDGGSADHCNTVVTGRPSFVLTGQCLRALKLGHAAVTVSSSMIADEVPSLC